MNKLYKDICYEEIGHMSIEAEKSHSLLSTSQRPKKDSIVLVCVQMS